MNLIIFHKNINYPSDSIPMLFELAETNPAIAEIAFQGLISSTNLLHDNDAVLLAPHQWPLKHLRNCFSHYDTDLLLSPDRIKKNKNKFPLVLSNAMYVTSFDQSRLRRLLKHTAADIIAVYVKPDLLPYRETVKITSGHHLAGFRRFYCDAVTPMSKTSDWPHHIFITAKAARSLLTNEAIPLTLAAFLKKCRSASLSFQSMKIAGSLLDLETEQGLLHFLSDRINLLRRHNACLLKKSDTVAPRLFGKVIFGKDVHIDDGVIIVGPSIIGDNVTIGKNAAIKNCFISAHSFVPPDSFIQETIYSRKKQFKLKPFSFTNSTAAVIQKYSFASGFRYWPAFSYVRFTKRIFDIVVALLVLLLFAPVLPLICLAVKLTSPGPAFFKHRRQGLHGNEFDCLKFRTMVVNADKIQHKLRVGNQVDGPQFKISNDPRVTLVGRFLRDTWIDEIPQFFNILLGQMSLVGPRPSPKSENSLCPFWHYARLSVRPGITGLWQISRTRRQGQDFQEWIYYDTSYVKNISLRLDLWICWKTAVKLIKNFVKHF